MQSHDVLENPRTLCLTLRTKYGFSTRWKYLKDQLAEGKGLSQVSPAIRNTEEIQPQDPHLDHGLFEQPHPDITKEVSDVEPRREDLDSLKEIDHASLSSPLYEDTKPDSRHHKAKNRVVDLHEGELDMVNLGDRSQYHPKASSPLDAPINTEVANTLSGDESYSQLDAAAIPSPEFGPSKHGALIDYEKEGDYDEELNYPGTSTGSSTIQGEVLETVADRLGRLPKRTTMFEQHDESSRLASLESHSINVQDDQLISSSTTDGIDGGHCGVISDTENGRKWNAASKYPEHRENLQAFKHLDRCEKDPIVESDGYNPASHGTETPISIPDLEINESNEQAGTRHNQGGSILSMSNIEARQEEDYIHENPRPEPFITPLSDDKETENDQESRDTSRSPVQNTALTSSRVEDMVHASHGVDLRKKHNDFSILQNISQIPNTKITKNPQGKSADDDEITYEGDGNDPEPSRTYTSKQISNLTPQLKRTRSELEDSGTLHSNSKGEDLYFVKF